MEEPKIRRARVAVELYGEPITYRGEKWLYIREMPSWVERAIERLVKAKKLKRWSSRTKNVVKFIG